MCGRKLSPKAALKTSWYLQREVSILESVFLLEQLISRGRQGNEVLQTVACARLFCLHALSWDLRVTGGLLEDHSDDVFV